MIVRMMAEKTRRRIKRFLTLSFVLAMLVVVSPWLFGAMGVEFGWFDEARICTLEGVVGKAARLYAHSPADILWAVMANILVFGVPFFSVYMLLMSFVIKGGLARWSVRVVFGLVLVLIYLVYKALESFNAVFR